MASVLDRLEALVREVTAALRDNWMLFGRVESVLTRVEALLSGIEAEKGRTNDLAEAETKSTIATQAAWRDALKVVIGWSQTRTAAIIATAVVNLVLAWLAHWSGMPLPFLPAEASSPAPIIKEVSDVPPSGSPASDHAPARNAGG